MENERQVLWTVYAPTSLFSRDFECLSTRTSFQSHIAQHWNTPVLSSNSLYIAEPLSFPVAVIWTKRQVVPAVVFAQFVLRLSSGWLQPPSLWGQPVPLLWACPFLEAPVLAVLRELFLLVPGIYTVLAARLGFFPGKWYEVAQLCPTLCDSVDCSLPGSSVHGIFQARILEWVAISFSRGSSRPKDRTQVSCTAADSLPSEPPGKFSSLGVLLSRLNYCHESWHLEHQHWSQCQLI